MVLGVKMELRELHGGRRRRIASAMAADSSGNFGDSLDSEVITFTQPQADISYMFYFGLFMLNHAPIIPLPGATIKSDFKLENVWRKSMYFVNEGYGFIATSYLHYTVTLKQRDIVCLFYGVMILRRDIKLSNNHNNFFTLELATVSSLV
jgi:hypothetical protein